MANAAESQPAPVKTLLAAPLANICGVRLAWTPGPSDTHGYVIERSRDGNRFDEVSRVAGDTTAYIDTAVLPKTTYTYRVRPLGAGSTTSTAVVTTATGFRIFDCTYFRNKPDLARYGIEKLYITGGSFMWRADQPQGGYDMTTPNEKATRNVARNVANLGQVLVIDIEHWPVDIRRAPEADCQASIRKLTQIIGWVRSERPNIKIGIYGFGPLRDYWTPVLYLVALEKPNERWFQSRLPEFTQKYHQWQQANDFLKPLMDKVDYIFPSLYTFYDEPSNWVLYAKSNIQEARRYGKPVIPFLWMDYHDSTAKAGQRLSPDFWRLQLQTIRQSADGMVIWGGIQYSKNAKPQEQQWNENDPWWVETKAFLTTPQ